MGIGDLFKAFRKGDLHRNISKRDVRLKMPYFQEFIRNQLEP